MQILQFKTILKYFRYIDKYIEIIKKIVNKI